MRCTNCKCILSDIDEIYFSKDDSWEEDYPYCGLCSPPGYRTSLGWWDNIHSELDEDDDFEEWDYLK